MIPSTPAPDVPFAFHFLRKLLHGYFRVVHLARFEGRECLPPPGPCLFAANHQSYYDPLLVAAGQAELMKFMAWEDLFTGGKFDRFIRYYGAFPVDTEGKDPSGFRTCMEHLKQGDRILIFPEGERSYDGRLLPFREGVARLAMRAGVPISPVCIRGADWAWPRGDTAPRPWFPIRVHYLPPVYPRPARTPVEKREEARRITEEVMAAIQRGLD